MRELKFRYVFKDNDTQEVDFKIFSIDDIENSLWYDFLCNYDGDIEFISRDQYTGLKDKNGVEIYFDDLVKAPSGNIFQVVWNDEEMRICLKDKDYFYNFNVPLYEKIGDIHQNPELLEVA